MPCNKTGSTSKTILILQGLLLCLLCTSCAQKRWTDAVSNEENSAMEQVVVAMQEREQQCSQKFDADMRLFWNNPLSSRAVEGYMQMLSPSSMKFVVSNPLGQPVFAFSGNGKTFQILQPRQQTHIRGSVRSLALRNKMPLIMTLGNWFAYMTSRLPMGKLVVVETAQDRNGDTFWLQIAKTSAQKTGGFIYLHLDPQKKDVLGYLFLDNAGETLAEISYPGKKIGNSDCPVQTEITIEKLPWDSTIRIQLENIASADSLKEQDFPLPVPAGFNTQVWP